ncbi:hypothetical protein ACT048_20790 [Ectopseudomonas khazarica]|uniref:hypothetical protein n=1 Tax=Ectopseudomonas khazarica TaxID=2502979 RepID=UPI0015CE5FC4
MVLRLRGYKKLKGGKQKLNDLSRNFHHLLTVSLKNLAAWQRLDNVEQPGIAQEAQEYARPEDLDFVLEDGERVSMRSVIPRYSRR